MLTEPTIEKLASLKLSAMAEAWLTQQKDSDIAALGFDDRFAMLVDAEHLARRNRRLTNLLRQAKLRITDACVEDVDCKGGRGLDKRMLRDLATCRWIEEHHNLVICGKTGVGKTYICCALANQACRNGFRTIYRRASRLFDELTLARADGTYHRLLSRIARVDLLVVDDWALVPATEPERRDLLEILEDRYGNRSTILTSQLPIEMWHDQVGDPTIADAICDRLLHNAYRLVLQGETRRK